ncbi:hypothetical protein BDA96_10G226300 [Sorghum bicolor]|uniref:Uncharacterized protein n=1 Tax=Sorghum bicolor TaxID=4558 RepID=A0A921Q4L8_SORBI|nr:hypothetical protein BDA96_10G226300 [Sorghum bicolor]
MRTPHQFSLTGGKARVKPEPCRTAGANPVALNEQIFSAVDGIIGTVPPASPPAPPPLLPPLPARTPARLVANAAICPLPTASAVARLAPCARPPRAQQPPLSRPYAPRDQRPSNPIGVSTSHALPHALCYGWPAPIHAGHRALSVCPLCPTAIASSASASAPPPSYNVHEVWPPIVSS